MLFGADLICACGVAPRDFTLDGDAFFGLNMYCLRTVDLEVTVMTRKPGCPREVRRSSPLQN